MGLDRDEELDMDKKTEGIINEYLNNLDVDTEGIWNRIETGLNKVEADTAMTETDGNAEITQPYFKVKKSKKRKITAYIWGGVGVAAVVAATIIVLPLATGVRTKDSDKSVYKNIKEDTDAIVAEDTSAEIESIKDNADSEGGAGNSLGFEEAATEAAESVNSMETQTDGVTGGNGATEAQTVETTESRELTSPIDNVDAIDVKLKILEIKDDKALCEVTYIAENEFGILAGQEIYVKIAGDDGTFSEYEVGDTLLGLLTKSEEEELYCFFLYDD